MEFKTVEEFEAGRKVEGYYIIKGVECRSSANNVRYLDFTLGDKTGDIKGKLWDCVEDDIVTYYENMLVKVRASVNEWQGALQLKIEKIRPSLPEDNVDPANFVPVAPYEPEYMFNELLSYIAKIENKDIKNITNIIINQNRTKLMTYPAAKSNHHSIRSGLLYHIMSMLRTGEKICEVYTFLNRDLLYSGIMLHDIAKLFEMDASELGIVTEYTTEGQLLGHIIQGIKMVDKVAEDVRADKEIALLLEHMILSHHYEAEYGSPKKPMIPEGEILHHLDMMDARMYDMEKALDGTEEGQFSDKVWSMDNRKIYKTVLGKEE